MIQCNPKRLLHTKQQCIFISAGWFITEDSTTRECDRSLTCSTPDLHRYSNLLWGSLCLIKTKWKYFRWFPAPNNQNFYFESIEKRNGKRTLGWINTNSCSSNSGFLCTSSMMCVHFSLLWSFCIRIPQDICILFGERVKLLFGFFSFKLYFPLPKSLTWWCFWILFPLPRMTVTNLSDPQTIIKRN